MVLSLSNAPEKQDQGQLFDLKSQFAAEANKSKVFLNFCCVGMCNQRRNFFVEPAMVKIRLRFYYGHERRYDCHQRSAASIAYCVHQFVEVFVFHIWVWVFNVSISWTQSVPTASLTQSSSSFL
jgi:hypothetical protein